jgi:hypothetical protein
VDAADALADLLEISSHIEAAVLFEPDGAVTTSTLPNEPAAAALARAGADVIAAAASLRSSGPEVTRVEAAFSGGSLFVVRDGERLVAATTVPDPPSALVLYDLRTLLKSTAPEAAKPKQRRRATRATKVEDADVTS